MSRHSNAANDPSSNDNEQSPKDHEARLVARAAGQTLTSHAIGALPILNSILERLRLEEFLRQALPPDDKRVRVPTVQGLLVLLRNVLVSREPIYGVREWAARHAPHLFGMTSKLVAGLNDDRVGRCLDKLFDPDCGTLVLTVVQHAIREFGVSLDQLHNDSTTITFHGAHQESQREQTCRGRLLPAITWGHNKDHRPDLKQLLYILTVTEDGAVPVMFRVESGNTADDQTHQATWDLLCQLSDRRDFLYVADCKLATRENMAYIHQRGGRFLSVLPRSRTEDTTFREKMMNQEILWRFLWDKTDEGGDVIDRYSVCDTPETSVEGYRVVWYRSMRKAEFDAMARSQRIERAMLALAALGEKLRSPRTRYRQHAKVAQAVEDILAEYDVAGCLKVQITSRECRTYKQTGRGRPTKDTRYEKLVDHRFDLTYTVDQAQIDRDRLCDGIFPLISNDFDLTKCELLWAYKRQPAIEKRFSQMKSDFWVAPVYLQSNLRIQSLLCVYFFALLVEALLERELRSAMERAGLKTLPLYPEGRDCRYPTSRRLIDVFENVQRHTLDVPGQNSTVMYTELSKLQRRLLKLLGLPTNNYGR
jgi:transposase